MAETQKPAPKDNPADTSKHQQLVKQVADKVWKLWQEELRRDRERKAARRRS